MRTGPPGWATAVPIRARDPPAPASEVRAASTRRPLTRLAKNRLAASASSTPARVSSRTHSPARPLPSGWPQSAPCSSVTPSRPTRQPALRHWLSGDCLPRSVPLSR